MRYVCQGRYSILYKDFPPKKKHLRVSNNHTTPVTESINSIVNHKVFQNSSHLNQNV